MCQIFCYSDPVGLNALLLMMDGDETAQLSLPVSGLVDGAPQRGRAGPELAGVRAVGALQVAA